MSDEDNINTVMKQIRLTCLVDERTTSANGVYTLGQLKIFASQLGLTVGKSKSELVTDIRNCLRNGGYF